MLPLTFDHIPKPIFPFNSFVCRLQFMVVIYFYFVTSIILIILSVMRYVKIVKSYNFQRYFCKRNMVVIVGSTWLSPMLLALPPVIGFWGKLIYRPSYGGICIFDLQPPINASRMSYNIIVIGMLFFMTNIIISWCYYRIYNVMRKSANRIRGFAAADRLSTSKDSKILVPSRQKKETKIATTLFLIYIAHFISYWPIGIASGLSLFGFISQSLMELVIFTTIMYSNSIINPWIILYSQRYRKYLKDLFGLNPTNTSAG